MPTWVPQARRNPGEATTLASRLPQKARAQQVSADSLELLTVASVDGGRGVEVRAEGGLGQRGGKASLHMETSADSKS